MEGGCSGDVDISLQQVDEIESESGEIEEGAALFKLHEEVHVTFGGVLSPRYSSKNARTYYSPAPHQALDFRPEFQERRSHVPILPLTPSFSPFLLTNHSVPGRSRGPS